MSKPTKLKVHAYVTTLPYTKDISYPRICVGGLTGKIQEIVRGPRDTVIGVYIEIAYNAIPDDDKYMFTKHDLSLLGYDSDEDTGTTITIYVKPKDLVEI